MEQDANLINLFAAYTVFWVVVFGYVLYLGKRQKRLEEAIADLDARLPE